MTAREVFLCGSCEAGSNASLHLYFEDDVGVFAVEIKGDDYDAEMITINGAAARALADRLGVALKKVGW